MTSNGDFIEQRIIEAVRGLLTGKVNENLGKAQFSIPMIEFGNYSGGTSVVPVIALSTCERTEKERIIRQDSYSLTITFNFGETPESELHCYAYSGAVGRVVDDDPTLGGVVDRAVINGKKYVQPKKPHCGEGWQLVISLRITVEDC
jgi:hypothetical protein